MPKKYPDTTHITMEKEKNQGNNEIYGKDEIQWYNKRPIRQASYNRKLFYISNQLILCL